MPAWHNRQKNRHHATDSIKNPMTNGPFAVSLAPSGPLGEIHFNLENRLCSVYGKNGIGKTWLLRSLHHALSGIDTGRLAYVHLRLEPEWLDEDEEHASDPLNALLLDALQQQLDRWYGGGPYLGSAPREGTLSQLLVSLLAADDSVESGSVFSNELSRGCRLSLQPIGRDTPRWRVHVSLSPSEDTPALSALLGYKGYRQSEQQRIEELIERAKEEAHSRGLDTPPDEAIEDVLRAILREGGSDDWHDHLGNLGVAPSHLHSVQLAEAALPGLVGSGLPIPLVGVCDLTLARGFSVLVSDVGDAIEERTLAALSASTTSIIEAMSDTEVFLTPAAAARLQRVSSSAARYLADALGTDSPQLRCRIIPGWRESQPLIWEASTDAGSEWFPYKALGTGHQRWAVAATHLALLDFEADVVGQTGNGYVPSWQSILLMDEPEAGLHPMAQREAFEGLGKFASGYSLVVASHSSVPFGMQNARLLYLHRGESGKSELAAMEDEMQRLLLGDRGSITTLGLDPADAFQAISTFLLVEGEHDVAVLTSLVSPELTELRVACLPFRGTKAVGAAAAEMQLRFTDARVCFLVDNNSRGLAETAWREAQRLARRGERALALKELDLLGRGTPEQQFLQTVCVGAIKHSHHDRVQVTGWNAPDVICLLPVEEFLRGFKSWHEVELHRRNGQNLKDTVAELGGSRISARSLARDRKS